MVTSELIKQMATALTDDLLAIRRHLHKFPELSFEEHATSEYIKSILDKSGIAYSDGWGGGTGIVATIQGKDTGKSLILRADIDALPITEVSGRSYGSTHTGIMHACGHDVHTTCVLGAGLLLNRLRSELPVNVVLVFQPGEEKLPGGASIMLKENLIEKTQAVAILGQHVHPPLETGKVGIKSGMYMASADEIYITVKGNGGHGATPHLAIDTILIAAEIVTGLQSIVSRRADPTIPSVLTIGKINSVGGATNIIPAEVKLEGTFRTMDEVWRHKAHALIQNFITETANAHGGTAEVDIQIGYPFLKNEEILTQKVLTQMTSFLGNEHVVELPIRMTAEDFAFYTHQVPGCFYRLGTGNESKGITSSVHTATFDIDESALQVGAGLMAWLALTLEL